MNTEAKSVSTHNQQLLVKTFSDNPEKYLREGIAYYQKEKEEREKTE